MVKYPYMSVSLHVSRVSKSFNNLLFSDVNIAAMAPAKIGLIGDNGSGKSTFLKILAGVEVADRGQVVWSSGSEIGYLEQEIVTDTYDVSGGEKKILRLSELFYSDYNVLLLDEPDNHLDLDHKIWFEQLVQDFSGIAVVISHDRKFLETAVDKIWLVDEGRIKEYSFNYTKFKEVYEGEMSSRQHLWEVQEKERQRLEEIVSRFRRWAAANSDLAGRYHSAIKRYEKFVQNMVAKPPEAKKIGLKVNLGKQHERKTAVHIMNVAKSYGENKVLAGADLHLFCGEKIGIFAPNGAGKSTLLNILVGKISPDSGTVSIGPGLKLGYYAQEHLDILDEQATLIEEIQRSAPFDYYDAVGYLKRFLFDKNQASQETRLLSGGQKSRLQLAKFLATNPDILVLDEPTNHLDLKTVIALENFLKNYAGTLVLVSHDRELVRNVVNVVYKLKNGCLYPTSF